MGNTLILPIPPTEAAPLAREGHQAVQATRAPEPGKPAGDEATPEEGAELVLDEPRQAVSARRHVGWHVLRTAATTDRRWYALYAGITPAAIHPREHIDGLTQRSTTRTPPY